jgi:hypothetical protein
MPGVTAKASRQTLDFVNASVPESSSPAAR